MKILYTHYKRYLLVPVLLLLAFAVKVQAQTTYPVQVNAHLLPPYSLYLSDYYSGTRDKLTLTLINRDQFKPTLNVRLRMTITAPGGVRLQTNDNAYVTPIIVETGAPVRLTQEDLEPYFRTDNLITQGFLTDGKLPEGMVQFCFQAIEAYTGRVLSASTCAQAFITSQKPPLLSLPLNNENIVYRDPLNILFQWTPLHQGLALVEYEFILKELWDNGMAVQAAFAYSPEIYRETTRSTSLPYGAVQPSLLPGKRYAWCVRAQARDGMETLNVFQNDGYTEVRTFTLQDNCLPPNLVNAVVERKTLKLDWPSLPEHIGFTVSYRLKSTNGTTNPWQDVQTLEPAATLYNLQSGGEYEYRVGSYCIAGQPVFTPILQATIPAKDSTRLAQCGIMAAVNLTNQEPLKQLKTSEVFMASDFPVTVTKVSGANGTFTGEGWIIVPWLNDAKVAVEFNSISINTDRQMTAGYIDAKYDKNESQIADLDDVFEGGSDAGTVQTGITGIDYTLDFSIPGVESFTLDDDGDLVITDDSGEPHAVVPKDNEGQGNVGNSIVVFPMAVKDKDGKMYQVEKVTETDPATGQTKEVAKATYIGQVRAPLAEGSFDRDQLDGDKAIVTFQKGAGRYAFDTWKDYYANVALIRDEYGDELWTGYRAAYKFLPENGSDVVQARIDIKDTKTIDPDKVLFITPKGTEYKATREGNVYTLTVTSGPVNDGQEVYALYAKTSSTYYTLGKFVVVTYAAQSHNVVLVSVNDAPVDEQAIRDTLQAVYGPVAITWSIKKQEFDYTSSSDKLMAESTGLSTYNDAMSALNSAYKAAHASDFDASANYLFFLKATGADEPNIRDYTGFMPRGAQFGYIFTSEITQNAIPTTVAHELGHGRWKLYHTFDNHYGGYNRGKTDNVMDYASGTVVAKWQWDILSDPAVFAGILGGDDESAMTSTMPGADKRAFVVTDKERIFLSPAGTPVLVPSGSKIYLVRPPAPWPQWALYAFDLPDGKYIAVGSRSFENHTFYGYVNFTSNASGRARYWTPNSGVTFHTGENTVTLINYDVDSCKMELYQDGVRFTDAQIRGYTIYEENAIKDNGDYSIIKRDNNDNNIGEKTVVASTGRIDCNGSQGSLTFVDYSTGKNGTSPLSQEDLAKMKNAMEEMAKRLGLDIKTYLLNNGNPSYAGIKTNFDNDAAKQKILIILDEDRLRVNIIHNVSAPQWLLEIFPNGPPQCAVDYINEGLDELHSDAQFYMKPAGEQAVQEWAVAAYRGVFGYLYCATDSSKFRDSPAGMQFVAGAVHELIATVDVVEMVKGVATLAVGIVKNDVDSYSSFVSDLKDVLTAAKSGQTMSYGELAQKLMPPMLRSSVKAGKTVASVAKSFAFLISPRAGKIRAYNIGRFTVMVVPIVFTAGQWAIAKAPRLIARFTRAAGADGKAVAGVMAEAEALGYTTTRETIQGEKTSLDIVETTTDASGNANTRTVAHVERDGDAMTVSGEDPLVPPGAGAAAEEVAGLLARHPDLRFMYSGMQKALGDSYTLFENALKKCSDDVMAVFAKNPELMYKLGDVKPVASDIKSIAAMEAELAKRMKSVAKSGDDFGPLRVGTNKVGGLARAELFSVIKSGSSPGLTNGFGRLDEAARSVFLDRFQGASPTDLARLADTDGALIDTWKLHQTVDKVDLLVHIESTPHVITDHFQRRVPPSKPSQREVKGAHDQTVWDDNTIVKKVPDGTPIPNNLPPNHPLVPDAVIIKDGPHPTVPHMRVVEYKIPKLNQAGMTDGGVKSDIFTKTIYDPVEWPDARLIEAGNDALKDAYKTGNVFPPTTGSSTFKFKGTTRDGYKIEGFIDVNTKQVQTFYFL